MNKRILIPLMLAMAAAPLAAEPFDPPVEYERAKVIRVDPIYNLIEHEQPRRDCYTEEVYGSRTHSDPGATLVGGILGGVIGHNLGHGDRGATAFGTLVGATIASNNSTYEEPYSRDVRRCTVRTDYVQEERMVGYRVTYRYRGHDYTTRMDRDPGKFVRLRVEATPVD